MRSIVWLGEPYFANELEACGWQRVFIHKPKGHRAFSWREIVELAGFEPDVLVAADHSTPPFVLGVEQFPCVTVFYSVDSHIHSWHGAWAQAFDASLVSLKDHLGRFQGPFLGKDRVWWSPAFARALDAPNPDIEKSCDCLFVGTDNAALMPRRHAFLKSLRERVPGLRVESGDYRRLFPSGRTLVNHAEHGDLNFRVFEAMGCGGCLVTPRIGHGLAELFVDGEHYVGYAPDDPGDAAYRINFLLEHPELREHIAKAALEAIDAGHRARHRAESFTDNVCGLAAQGAGAVVSARLARAEAIRNRCLAEPYLLWAMEMRDADHKRAFLAAAKGAFGLEGISA